jgi:CRISPR-associated protein Csy1
LAIATFIDERREAKLKGKEPDPDAGAKYEYGSWLTSAASSASHIQMATHVAKATHPKSQDGNFLFDTEGGDQHQEIGSHWLAASVVPDAAVNDAKHLVAYSLLSKVEVEGKQLLHWLKCQDTDLCAALDDDPARASELLKSFGAIFETKALAQPDSRGKQVFWLTGNDPADDSQFDLLQPLFPSSLVQAVHEEIQDAIFGETNAELRKARREKQESVGVYREYQGLAVRVIGGSNAQNVSQLNSKRRGVNYLLPSLPPEWKSAEGPRLAGRTSAIEVFGRQRAVRELIDELAAFLKTDPPANMATRLRREGIEQALGVQLSVFAEHVQDTHPLGWTRDATCELPECEKLWLDPGRADPEKRATDHLEQDQSFERAYHGGNWPDEVASRFANWVNAQLRKAGIEGLGDAEYHHWGKQAIVEAAWPVPLQRRTMGVTA